MQRLSISLAVFVLAGVLPAASATQVVDAGAAMLFELEHVTVVHPAGDDEDGVRYRLAAESKASLLERRGVRATVRADDALSDEERAGDLLLLGWDNALLSRPELAGVSRNDDGFSFFGIRHDVPADDLMFFATSPFDPASHVMFWSRSDPELDRFMTLPILGSHWAVYRDFLPVRQGMFVPGPRWPPKREPEAERDHGFDLSQLRRARRQLEGRHVLLDYDPATLAESEARGLLAKRERALERAAARLGQKLDDFVAAVYVYDDVKAKVALTGVPDTVHTLERRAEVHALTAYVRSESFHEELHVLARRELGPATLTAMFEGLALSIEESYRGKPLELHAAVLAEREAIPAVDAILDEARLTALPPEVRYPAAGLLVSWIRETGGDGAVARAYGMWRGTVDELAAVLQREPATLQAGFGQWVAARAATRRNEVEYMRRMAVAREHHVAGDHAAMAQMMREALGFKPDDPQALYNLAFAEMRTDRLAEAQHSLERILELDLGPDSRWTVLAHFDLGRVHDLQGRRKQALEQYRRVLEFPGRNEMHLLAREAIESPVTRDSLQ